MREREREREGELFVFSVPGNDEKDVLFCFQVEIS
jgi:hypothetical protein